MNYVNRSLCRAIRDCLRKVVIVEGARAVGKTRMVRQELEPLGYAYYTLADSATHERAKADPNYWIRSIGHPAIIDEAQRVKGLTLAIKEYVDERGDSGNCFILTGSASIGKAGLDGQDPLTRRSQRFSLSPFTQREIIGNSANLVDDLWDGRPDLGFRSNLSDTQLAMQMSIGGFPEYVQAGVSGKIDHIGDYVRSDLRNVLGDTLLPEERFDRAIARSILDWLLSLPGDVLNMSKVGRELGCDNRTVERYVSIFSNRFLVRHLPNLKQSPQKQNFTRAKIHPVDVSFSVEALRESGKDPFADRSLLGKVLESYVVSQIVPDAQWGVHRADCYYWRESGRNPKEVDLALLCKNELVGIEIKASTSVSQGDFAGLYALASDPRFHRGYVVYLGERVEPFSERMCAVPVSALWDPAAFDHGGHIGKEVERPMKVVAPESETGEANSRKLVDANLFLSYCHEDDEHLDGAMVAFVRELEKEYEYQFGRKLQTFVDQNALHWGDDWQAEIDRNIEETHFFMPCVTPRYLLSKACREEFLRFLSRAEQEKRCKIMSLVWQDFKRGEIDQVSAAIGRYQYSDVSYLRDLLPQDREYKEKVRELVVDIHKAVEENIGRLMAAGGQGAEEAESPSCGSGDDEGLVEKLDRITSRIPAFKEAAEDLKSDLAGLTTAFDELPFPDTKAGGYTKWGIALAERTKPDLTRMNVNLDKINELWIDCYDFMASSVRLGREMGQGANEVLPLLYDLRNSFGRGYDVGQVETLAQMLPQPSSRLRPLANGLRRLLNTFRDIEGMLNGLIEKAEAAAKK